ncbi:hypothetical protein V8E53_012235 [Lactarius tabidus]
MNLGEGGRTGRSRIKSTGFSWPVPDRVLDQFLSVIPPPGDSNLRQIVVCEIICLVVSEAHLAQHNYSNYESTGVSENKSHTKLGINPIIDPDTKSWASIAAGNPSQTYGPTGVVVIDDPAHIDHLTILRIGPSLPSLPTLLVIETHQRETKEWGTAKVVNSVVAEKLNEVGRTMLSLGLRADLCTQGRPLQAGVSAMSTVLYRGRAIASKSTPVLP